MAISVSPSSSRRSRHLSALADINIIPLVDVVLVLLIIFMLTAHVMEFGLEIEVPSVDQTRASVEELPVVSITKTGEFFLGSNPGNINSLGAEVRKRYQKATGVYVRADKDTTWQPIAQVVSALTTAGLEVRMVTQPMQDSPGR